MWYHSMNALLERVNASLPILQSIPAPSEHPPCPICPTENVARRESRECMLEERKRQDV